jgi:hypothetical protein
MTVSKGRLGKSSEPGPGHAYRNCQVKVIDDTCKIQTRQVATLYGDHDHSCVYHTLHAPHAAWPAQSGR